MLTIQKQILKNITLKLGVLQSINEYEYDCGIERLGNVCTLKDSYSHFIISLLQEVLQFHIDYTSSSTWGTYDASHDNWSGLVGLVKDNKTDIIICHWVMSDILAEFVDYLLPTLETKEAFVFQPHNFSSRKDVFRGTFSYRLWMFFFLTTFLIILAFKFSTFMHSKVRPDHESWKWDEVILWAIAAISQQSFSRHPRGSSCRTMFLIGYTITYLLYTGFAAGITSLLALQSYQDKLTFDDVAKMKLKVILHKDEFYLELLEKNMPSSFEIYLSVANLYKDTLSGIFSKITNSDFVGYGTTSVLTNYLRSKTNYYQRNAFVVFPVSTNIRKKAFLIRKSFPFKEIFNYWLIKLYETGLLNVGRKRYLISERNNLNNSGDNSSSSRWSSANLGNVLSAFEFLIAGWILSIVVWILEIIWYTKSTKNSK